MAYISLRELEDQCKVNLRFMYLTKNEKLNMIEKEYDIPSEDLRKDVSVMCNLSQGIVDDTKVEIIMNMYENTFSLEQISLATKKAL